MGPPLPLSPIGSRVSHPLLLLLLPYENGA